MSNYDDLIKDEKLGHSWRHSSRCNYYEFYTKNGYRDIVQFIAELDVKSILDFGCGNNDLSYVLNDDELDCYSYDPYVSHFSKKPTTPRDLTILYNVLQCIEDSLIDETINDLYIQLGFDDFDSKLVGEFWQRYIALHIDKNNLIV